MSLTQIASMYTGAPTVLDLGRLEGIKSTLGNIVHITDGKNDTIQSMITARNFIDNNHRKSLKDNLEIFDFEVLGEQTYDKYLVKGNRILIPSEDDGQLIEFVIDDVHDGRGANGKTIEVFTYASYLDLKKARIIDAETHVAHTATLLANKAVAGTDFEVGFVESDREITVGFDDYTDPYTMLKRIALEFELELNFRVEHSGNKVIRRYVDLLDRVGVWRGREVTFGKDLQEIKRIESGDIYTALLGLGPEKGEDEGDREEVFVEDIDALNRWGRPDSNGKPQHLVGVYEPTSDREDMTSTQLRQYTRTELNKRINSTVTYEVAFLDLEHILGHENKKLRFGDTIRIKDTLYDPPLYVEARIHEQDRDVITQARKEVVLGDFVEYTEDEAKEMFTLLKNQLKLRVSVDQLKEYAEPKRIESNTPPTGQNEHVIWVDTSKLPYVAKVFNGGKWEKLSPTEPSDIGAYDKSEVDQAVKDAKAYSENASNIKDGIIDVGQIPLRTSATGATVDWDGVNGLVQYNSAGTPVSWWNLNGESYMSNAFVSGRIEANEGFFGKNERVTIGDNGLTIRRPDDAIYMQDGLVKQSYGVSSFDPHDMDLYVYRFDSGGYESYELFRTENKFYRALADTITGASLDGGRYDDIRDPDKGYTVKFTSYEFVHEARYLVIGYRPATNSNNPRHQTRVYEIGSPPAGYSSIYAQMWHERGGSGYTPIVIDVGVPTYQRRRVEFRIGINRPDNSGSNDILIFRVNRIFQTDDP